VSVSFAYQDYFHKHKGDLGLFGKPAHFTALKQYEDELVGNPDSYECLIGTGREMLYLGYISDMIEPDGKAEDWYSSAIEIGKKTVDLEPGNPHGHFLLAVSKARLGKYCGIRESIKYSKEIKAHADTVLSLDPVYYQANYLLGKWHQTIANVSWIQRQVVKLIFGGIPKASNEMAIEHYKKEIENYPGYVIAYKELGGLYMNLKKWDLAKKYLELCVDLPDNEEFDHIYKEQARELLEKVIKKTEK